MEIIMYMQYTTTPGFAVLDLVLVISLVPSDSHNWFIHILQNFPTLNEIYPDGDICKIDVFLSILLNNAWFIHA